MVTTTPSARTPHALESGPRLSALWAARTALSAAGLAAIMLTAPTIGRSLTWNGTILTLRPSTLVITATIVALAALILLSRAAITRSLNMAIPGKLAINAPPARPALQALTPAVLDLVLLASATHAATHSTADHGYTRLLLMALAVILPTARLASLAFRAATHHPHWRATAGVDLAEAALICLIAATTSTLASEGILSQGLGVPDMGVSAALLTVLIVLLREGVRWDARRREEGTAPQGPDPARAAVFRVATRLHADLTVEKYQRTYRLVLRGICLAGALAGVAVLLVLVLGG